MPVAPEGWTVERDRGPAAALHGRSVAFVSGEAPAPRLVARLLEASRPALVIGSTQRVSQAEEERAVTIGLDVVRRPSAGGAVVVATGTLLWVDLLVGAGESWWEPDVRRQAYRAGELWAAALDDSGAGPASVWRGGMSGSRWTEVACFAGMGPGEVSVGGKKVVGISQRRTSRGVLLQTAVLVRWDPAPLVEVFGGRGLGPRDDLAAASRGVGEAVVDSLLEALLARLTP